VLEKLKICMDGRGRALDNIFIERFWRSLKQEKIYLIILTTPKETRYTITLILDKEEKRSQGI